MNCEKLKKFVKRTFLKKKNKKKERKFIIITFIHN